MLEVPESQIAPETVAPELVSISIVLQRVGLEVRSVQEYFPSYEVDPNSIQESVPSSLRCIVNCDLSMAPLALSFGTS